MSRLPPHSAVVYLATVHLLLLSICPVSSRIYQTNDAVVIEVDETRADQPSIRSARSSNYGNPAATIPMPYVVNPFTGLYYHQQPNFPSWPYPLRKSASTNVSDVEDDSAATSPESRQQIACGVGPDSPPTLQTAGNRIVGGTTANRNTWPFVVGLRKLNPTTASAGDVFCGGSLISQTRILTAASCVERLSLNAISSLTVSLGMRSQGDPSNDKVHDARMIRKVTRAVYHMDYDTKTKYNDIAILMIDPPVTYFDAVSHVCLPPPSTAANTFAGKDAVIMGWGKIEVDDTRASNLADQPPTRSARSSSNGNPAATIPVAYAINPFTGLYYHQQPNFPSWPYPLSKSASNVSDVEDEIATSPESRQQKIACGVGPDSPPQRSQDPTVGIVGGSDAEPNSWPFIVGLRTDYLNSPAASVSCGGSLISETRILTAAHCVNEMSAYEMASMTVNLGMHTQGNVKGTFNDARKTRKVTRVVFHKDYDAGTKFNDIAVLTIDPPVTYTAEISPVCLPPPSTASDQFVNKDAAIMGWGTLKSKGSQPNALQQATVNIISNAKCKKQYGTNSILNQQLCASAEGKDTCQGDSGGPIVVQKSNGSPWTQVGVVSYGRGCADPNFAGVYASVAFFRNWINTYMNN